VVCEHNVPAPAAPARWAAAAGLEPAAREDACVGPEVRELYELRGRSDAYREQLGLPLVLGLLFRRG
jgi:hypothetical protein